jgi:hypothetical protein
MGSDPIARMDYERGKTRDGPTMAPRPDSAAISAIHGGCSQLTASGQTRSED